MMYIHASKMTATGHDLQIAEKKNLVLAWEETYDSFTLLLSHVVQTSKEQLSNMRSPTTIPSRGAQAISLFISITLSRRRISFRAL